MLVVAVAQVVDVEQVLVAQIEQDVALVVALAEALVDVVASYLVEPQAFVEAYVVLVEVQNDCQQDVVELVVMFVGLVGLYSHP